MNRAAWKVLTVATLLLGGLVRHAEAASIMGTPVVWLKSDGSETTKCAITNYSSKDLTGITLVMKGDSNITVTDLDCGTMVPGQTCYTSGFTGTGQRRCVAIGAKARQTRMALNKCNFAIPFECTLVVEGR